MKRAIIISTLLLVIWLGAAVSAQAAEDVPPTHNSAPRASAVTSLSIASYPEKTIYGAFEELDCRGLVLHAVFDDGRERDVTADEITVVYQRDTRFRVGDSYVSLCYGGARILLPVTVNRIRYDLDSLSLGECRVEYNGEHQGYTNSFPSIVGLDGVRLGITAEGGGVDVGEYDVSINFHSESLDYYIPESRMTLLHIEPCRREIVWSNRSFVYDGKSKSPTAYYLDVNGNKVHLPIIGSAINAGTDYTAKVTVTDRNYTFTSTSVSYEIKRADYDFSGVVWSVDSFTYDGKAKSISVSGLPLGVDVVSYLGDRATDAGEYTVTAALSWDRENYNQPAPLTHLWRIERAEYDTSRFRFETAEYVYDGAVHYPILVGEMPVGADGIALEYSFSGGACHVSEGRVTSIVIFRTDSPNYNTPDNIYSSVSITPLGIEVKWGELELYYSGEIIAPVASSPLSVIEVRGGARDVGEYQATAYTENTDYVILNESAGYVIKKSENSWIRIPGHTVCYEGRVLSLPCDARFGEAEWLFFSDALGECPISAPTECGSYYAVAMIADTENYSGLISEIFSFDIVAVRAVSFYASLAQHAHPRAFSALSSDELLCTVVNNDGGECTVDPTLVSISYINGDSLRRTDGYVTVRYESFSYRLELSVDYADYSLDGVIWENADTVYDGQPHTPTLSGLPEGVTVTEYVGGGVIDAGKYTVLAVLSYDGENYNPPSVPSCTLTISKKPIATPKINAVYNGTVQEVLSDSPLYTLEYEGGFRDAGVYSVRAVLKDAKNYTFVDGDTALACLEILPMTVTVRVDDVYLHLFERLKLDLISYAIADEGIITGDELPISVISEGDYARLVSENPNYKIETVGGRINRLWYPTFGGALMILLLCWSFMILVGAVCALVLERDRVADSVKILRCRWKNRRTVIYPPRKRGGTTAVKPAETEERVADEAVANVEEKGVATDEPSISGMDFGVDAERADALISDSLAKSLIKHDSELIVTEGRGRSTVNIDELCEKFSEADRVDINSMKDAGLIPREASFVKVLARGVINKPLKVYANDFTLSAVKMIALTGGEAIKALTVKPKGTE